MSWMSQHVMQRLHQLYVGYSKSDRICADCLTLLRPPFSAVIKVGGQPFGGVDVGPNTLLFRRASAFVTAGPTRDRHCVSMIVHNQ